MITLRPSASRGSFDFGWLDTRHTFSFGEYHDPAYMGFGPLRVINEDRVAPGKGFGSHPHRDMEIVSIVLSGALEHRDSLGTHGVIRPGEVQRITAGRGVVHSEFNASASEPVHFLQVWIMPRQRGLTPGYEQRAFAESERVNRFATLASADGAEGSIRIEQDARILRATLEPGRSAAVELGAGRLAWVHVVSGRVEVASHTLGPGDAAGIEREARVEVRAAVGGERADVLVFDLPQ